MKKEYQICTRCVMDTSDKEIIFNKKGECNHCTGHDKKMKSIPKDLVLKRKELERIVSKVKKAGEGKEYDCISGVSGGVDSTYLTYMLKQLGLRVLVVHLDNGWNS